MQLRTRHLLIFSSMDGHNQSYLLALVRNLSDCERLIVIAPQKYDDLPERIKITIRAKIEYWIKCPVGGVANSLLLYWLSFNVNSALAPASTVVMQSDLKGLIKWLPIGYIAANTSILEFRASHPHGNVHEAALRRFAEDFIVALSAFVSRCGLGFLDWYAAARYRRLFGDRRGIFDVSDPVVDEGGFCGRRDDGVKEILVFGIIDDRKNIEGLALALSRAKLEQSVRVIIAGPLSQNYQEKFNSCLSLLKRHAQVELHLKFFESDDVQPLFRRVDVVYMVYRGHVGMSSVLVRAAKAGKTVIAAKGGLIETLVRSFRLGVVVTTESEADLVSAIQDTVSKRCEELSETKRRHFASLHTENRFREKVLPAWISKNQPPAI